MSEARARDGSGRPGQDPETRLEGRRTAWTGGTLRIGITGPIGCGKSTVGAWLERLGGVHIDADEVTREATSEDATVLAGIRAWFGEDVVGPDGTLDRAALAAVVFADANRLRDLEAIVHPAVHRRLLASLDAAAAAGAPFVALEAIKLVEAGLAAFCDEVWIVACRPETQRERLAAKGMPTDDAERRIAAQGADLGDALAARLAAQHPALTVRRLAADGPPERLRAVVESLLDTALAARA